MIRTDGVVRPHSRPSAIVRARVRLGFTRGPARIGNISSTHSKSSLPPDVDSGTLIEDPATAQVAELASGL
jgi:hypothetical protein